MIDLTRKKIALLNISGKDINLLSLFILAVLLLGGCTAKKAKNTIAGDRVRITSPDSAIVFNLEVDDAANNAISYTIDYKSKNIIIPSFIKIESNFFDFKKGLKIVKVEEEEVADQWVNLLGERKNVPDKYHQAKIYFEKDGQKLNLICRVYNEGVALGYEIPKQAGKDTVVITNEDIAFNFDQNYSGWATYTAQGIYEKTPINKIKNGCERPFVIELDSALTLALAEAQLVDYARMKFGPNEEVSYGVKTILDGNVKKALPFRSPWRVVMIAENAGKLLEQNYLILNLNAPSAIEDPSWIKPGKALRDGTLTTKGGKACIDFAAQHNMQYVEFDAGWYGPENNEASNATTITLDPSRSKGPFDLHEIIRYGKKKGIGILLYVNRRALEQQLDEILPLYKEWGIAGIKFGFVRVGDQEATKWLHEAVKKAADYGFIVDVHDEYRPTGFSRTYPNLLTQEGIRGDEESIPNSHTLITMFTRMLAGAADNTVCYYSSRVTNKMGSHAAQLAKTVCLASPLQFLYWYDKPASSPEKKDGLWGKTNMIGNEPELEFFDHVPTTWDLTKVLHGKIGEYAVIARKKEGEWFVGGINNEEKRTVSINFDFLEKGKKYEVKIYADDSTVNTRTQVRIDKMDIDSDSDYTAVLGGGKGIAMHIVPKN